MKDTRFGFQLRIPKDFSSIPLNIQERWIAAKLLYKRSIEPGEGGEAMTPELRVIIFPKVLVRDVVKGTLEKERGDAHLRRLDSPFRNYREYLRENYKKGGWHVAGEKSLEIDGLGARKLRIEVRDQKGDGKIKRVLLVWEIVGEDATYVLQFETLGEVEHRFLRTITKTAMSFKKIASKASGSTGASRGDASSPEARREHREARLARARERALAMLPPGWKSFEQPPYTIVYHVKKKYATRVAKQADKVWQWMLENFGYFGEDFPIGGIVRICKDESEASAYIHKSTRSGRNEAPREIVVYEDKDWGWDHRCSGQLNTGIAKSFLADKSEYLWRALPPWLGDGLHSYVSSLRIKRGNLVSRPADPEMELIRDSLRKQAYEPIERILRSTAADYEAVGVNSRRIQAVMLVHFLLGKGQKDPKFRNLIPDYLASLHERLRTLQGEFKKIEEEAALREANKRKYDKKKKDEDSPWMKAWKKRRDPIYDECIEKTFDAEWTAKDWARLEKNWKKAFARK